MSSSLSIKVSNLCKSYNIYNLPHDRLKQSIYPRLQGLIGLPRKQYFHNFWALRNIQFEIRKGETIGIIGRNGSGKSTLLQLICGVLNPTEGVIESFGRIAALLELGSGFNPEFTGRENVYLNATILGLSNTEINKRFKEIEEFADIGEFIDQPVKTYSSGMFVRLAFAVIAHVDAEILIVDEALAVGDAIFSQKCMRFIRNFKKNGTLIFVSHDMSSVQNLCDKVIWLDKGEVRKIGNSNDIAEEYLQYTFQEIAGEEIKHESIKSNKKKSIQDDIENTLDVYDYESINKFQTNIDFANGWKTGSAEVLDVGIRSTDNRNSEINIFAGGEIVELTIEATAFANLDNPILGFLVRDKLGQDLFGENTLSFTDNNPTPVKSGEKFQASFCFKMPMLPNGQYVITASVADGDLHNHIQHHWLHDAAIINVSSSKVRWGLVGVGFQKIQLKIR